MGSDVLIRIRKCVVISARLCCRSVCHHPFLVGFLCWLYLFHRSFPVLFSLFVSALPVLITTAVLLGTLLSYGEPNWPQLDKEVGLGASHSFEVGAGCLVRELIKARDLEDEDGDDEKESERYDAQKEEVSDDDKKPLIKGKSRNDKWVSGEDVRGGVRSLKVDDEKKQVRRTAIEESGLGNEGASHSEEADDRGVYARVPVAEYEQFEAEDNHLVGDAVDGPYSLNAVYTSLSLSPKREEGDDHPGSDSQNENGHSSEIASDKDDAEDEEEDEDSSESESDANESSSPDASMADIMPMLDELHPLLDVDAPQPAPDGTNSTEHRSIDASSIESAEDSEDQEDEDEDGDGDNEEDAQSNKGEGDKPGISWTEDDQKNLMDMGTSELERNQRLENLIARRWARKLMRLADEKNLIDLESADLPFDVPHISTQRRNPFDAPLDSFDMMGLPPIPGSAPSILQPRRNPFDLPYDQNEEKPVLTGDNFAQEFIPSQREAFFRRHESFSVGPSTLGNLRQEIRWRPYFVPERTAAEEAYASIQRQLSEVSESKASSVPETESVSSATDHEDRKFTEQDISSETYMASKDENDSDHPEHESKSSEDAESVDVMHVNSDVNQNEFEIQLGDQGSLPEYETKMAVIEESSSHVESDHSEIDMRVHAVDENSEGSSHSSPTVEMQVEHNEISIQMGPALDDFREAGASISGLVETIRSEMHILTEQDENGSDSSSVTSLSETNEEGSDPVVINESVGGTGDLVEDSDSVVRSSIGESSASLTVEIPDNHHIKEPVYDSSPPPVEKHLLFTSESTHHQPESSEVNSPLVADEAETRYVNKGFEEHREREVVAGSSSESMNIDLSTGDENQETHSASQTAGQDLMNYCQAHPFQTAPLSDTSVDVDKEPSYKDEDTQKHVQFQNMEPLIDVGQTSTSEKTSTRHEHMMPADATLSKVGEDQFHLEAEQVSEIDRGSSSSDTDSSEDYYVGKEDMLRVEHDEALSSNPDDNESLVVQVSEDGPYLSSDSYSLEDRSDLRTLQINQDELSIPSSDDYAPNQERVSVEPRNQHAELKSELSLGEDRILKAHDTASAESSSNNHEETMEPATVEAESTMKTSSDDTAPRTFPEVSVAIPLKNQLIESIKEMSTGGVPSDKLDEFQTPVSARYFDFTSEGFQPNNTDIEEEDEDETEDFKDLDEGLLAELDTVGDFSVPNSGKGLLKLPVADHPIHSRDGIHTLNYISDTNTELPIFEASSVNGIDFAFRQIDDGVPVEEVILPSLLFGGRAAVDSNDVLVSEPDSPVSETKEVSAENEELVSPSTDALEETEVEPTSPGSAVSAELMKEDMHQEQGRIESPKHLPEEAADKDNKKREKSRESSSDSSSSDSDSD
uniref:Far1-related sequence 3 n=1 Tax=Kalanchoe fedtschenkoi TaxID=63787 RepID=A0A7N0ZUF9_KALFE